MFGERLKELRKEKGLSQKDLADLLKISASAIGMYEQGRRDPDTNTLKFLADFFDVSVDYLLGRTDIKEAVLLENDDLPDELKAIGIEYLEVHRELKKKGLTPDDILDIIQALEKAGLTKKE